MEKKCNNCVHFRKCSIWHVKHVWGYCTKPGKDTGDAQSKKTEGVFMWADKSCDDFETRKIPADQPAQDSL